MYRGEERVAELLARKGSATVEEIAAELNISADAVRKFSESLKNGGFVAIDTRASEMLTVTEEFASYKEKGELPEYAVFKKALTKKGIAELNNDEKSYGIGWAKKKGFILIEEGRLIPAKTHDEVKTENDGLLSYFDRIRKGERPPPVVLDELVGRKLVSVEKTHVTFIRWVGKEIPKRPEFDIETEGPDALIGRAHPLSVLETRIRRVFIALGFEEMKGGIVESAFWNFDALFQPQDHPARELADTFYLNGKSALPSERLVKRVRAAHERGWGYKWSPDVARQLVLRTHTTALSARYLAKLGRGGPKKYFAIGRVFRNEATDATHLAEFHQVEGIVVWEKATFRHLLGILKEFYARLGFEKIRFRPSYFPYTEPSLEVEIFLPSKGRWLEMGGAGIFRPEVSIPLANTYPVLAWGLSLERPLMLMLDLEDIRAFYRNDLSFLKSARF